MTAHSMEFRRPVVVQCGRVDRERAITNTIDAAQMLLHEWPLAAGTWRRTALSTCIEVLKGYKPANLARHAFIAAAQEARIHVASPSP